MQSIVKVWALCLLLSLLGCERPYQRFVPFTGDNASTALDTKTGQSCITLPKEGFARLVDRSGWRSLLKSSNMYSSRRVLGRFHEIRLL